MIRLRTSADDLAATRLAYSPLWETILSYKAVAHPRGRPFPVPWIALLDRAASRLDLRPLWAVLSQREVLFDFLLPVPPGPDPAFTEEVDRLRATPTEEVAREVGSYYESMDQAPPPSLRPYVARPRQSIDRLASALTSYWEEAFRPHWPGVRAALEADLLHRSRILAAEGTVAMLRGLHPQVHWRGGGLDVDAPTDWDVTTARPGVLLVPSAFSWPAAIAGTIDGVKVVTYSARGLGTLWDGHPVDGQEGRAIQALLGSTRARVILALRAHMATTDLAGILDVAESSVSYHLGHLRRAGLVEWNREGRRVVYRLSTLGAGLLGLWGLDEPPRDGTGLDGHQA